MTHIKSIFAAAVLAAAITAPANAALVTSFDGGLASPGAGFRIVNDFNGANAASSVVGNGYQIMPASVAGVGAAPGSTSPTGTPFLAVQGGGSATYSFAGGASAFQFDWGSVDTYNSLTVNYTLNGSSLSRTYTPGSNGFLMPADGNQTMPVTNGRLTVSGNAGERFTSVNFASSSNAFEVDNIAVAVPEPATWGMMILGFGLMGVALRRRSTNVAFA